MSRRRSGVTIVEALVSLLLGLTVISMGWSALGHQRTVASRLSSDMDILSARRLTALVIGKELRAGVRGRDWIRPGPDSLSLRAFRGWGLVCGLGSELGSVAVAYHGERAANPAKDSVLVLGAEGWRRADLRQRAVAPGSCDADLGGRSELWTLDPPVTGPLVARVFERGSYHIGGKALRYRRGRGGRQPLTSDVFDSDRSGIVAEADRVVLRLVVDPTPPGAEADSTVLRFWASREP
jgi:hypothetical protein